MLDGDTRTWWLYGQGVYIISPDSPETWELLLQNAIEHLWDVVEQGDSLVCAADKSAATVWCYHVNMDQNLWGMFPTPCWIFVMNY